MEVTGYWAEVVEGEDEAVDAIVVEEALVGATDVDSISESAVEVAWGEEDDTVSGSTGSGELSPPNA